MLAIGNICDRYTHKGTTDRSACSVYLARAVPDHRIMFISIYTYINVILYIIIHMYRCPTLAEAGTTTPRLTVHAIVVVRI